MSLFELDTSYWEHLPQPTNRVIDHMQSYLREGHTVKLNGAERILQILMISRQELTRAYDVYYIKADESFHLVRIRWVHYGFDVFQALPSGFVPEVEFLHKPLDRTEVETVYQALHKDIPIWFAPTIERRFRHADEVSYELALGGIA
ncbi:MAG UNVERIFIED_CONTAM: hypothetical protein LVT10_03605 [Anaerolineae bacterium]|jgi:hypothetical protein